eukprot:gene13287-biopygen3600
MDGSACSNRRQATGIGPEMEFGQHVGRSCCTLLHTSGRLLGYQLLRTSGRKSEYLYLVLPRFLTDLRNHGLGAIP